MAWHANCRTMRDAGEAASGDGAARCQIVRGKVALDDRMRVQTAASLADVGAQGAALIDRVRLDVGQARGAAARAERQQEWIPRKVHLAPSSSAGESFPAILHENQVFCENLKRVA